VLESAKKSVENSEKYVESATNDHESNDFKNDILDDDMDRVKEAKQEKN